MPIAGEIELQIEKLVYGGDGLGRIEGRTVLVPLVVPGERVRAGVVREEPRLLRARLVEVLDPSPSRIAPGCPYFARCGGCQYQQMTYAEQLRAKAAILRETLLRIGKIEAPEPAMLASEPWNYRNRTRFKTEKRAESFRLGYFELGSHTLLAIEQCPISSPRINALIPQLYDLGKRPDFPQGNGEIEVFADNADDGLLFSVYGAARWPETLLSAAREICPGVVSIGFIPPERDKPIRAVGKGHVLYRTGSAAFRVSHGSFFQTNRVLVDRLADAAVAGLSGDVALELFAGVGYFTLALSRDFRRVIAVEANASALRDLDSNRTRAGAGSIAAVHAGSEQYLETGGQVQEALPARAPARRRRAAPRGGVKRTDPVRPDAVLLDPPRAGLGERGAEQLAALGAGSIVYVSCDPATLARDLAVLIKKGYRLDSLTLVDLFPQTFHIETIAKLKR